MTTPAETMGYIKSPANQERVKQAYEKVMKKYKPPKGMGPLGGGGMPPGGEGGPTSRGGGPPDAGGNPNPNPPSGGNPARGVQLPSDKTWGSLPNHFDGMRLKADNFIDELKSYFHVNRLNAALQSLITKVSRETSHM
jgi:hypothetical protein